MHNAARTGFIEAVCTIVLAGCVYPASSVEMAARPAAIHRVDAGQAGYRRFVVGTIDGGSSTRPLGRSNVAGGDLGDALRQSMDAAGLLADSATPNKLRVNATMSDEVTSAWYSLFRLTVKSVVHYTVMPVAGGAPLFSEDVAGEGTKTTADAFLGTKRLRLAKEAAMRSNIELFVRHLADSSAARLR